MARAPKKTSDSAAAPDIRAKIVDALMELAAEQPFGEVTIGQIAERAGVSLADFRDCFPSKGAVLAAFNRRIDRQVLDGTTADMADENARERLFDVLMRRFDALAPYREGLRGISEWLRRDPSAAAALNRMAFNSMRFMLEAADIDTGGRIGAVKIQGLVLAMTRVMRTWLDDEDQGLAETMAELDRTLTRGGKFVERAKEVDRLVSPVAAMARGIVDAGVTFLRNRGPAFGRRRDGDANTAANEI